MKNLMLSDNSGQGSEFRPKNILVIDDDPISNMISTKMIEMNSDCPVISFTNPCAALKQLKNWDTTGNSEFPEIIFLDINMPEINGWEFLDEMQKLSSKNVSQCSVIMLTSSLDYNDIAKAKTYSAVQNFIPKPLTNEKLKAVPLTSCSVTAFKK